MCNKIYTFTFIHFQQKMDSKYITYNLECKHLTSVSFFYLLSFVFTDINGNNHDLFDGILNEFREFHHLFSDRSNAFKKSQVLYNDY